MHSTGIFRDTVTLIMPWDSEYRCIVLNNVMRRFSSGADRRSSSVSDYGMTVYVPDIYHADADELMKEAMRMAGSCFCATGTVTVPVIGTVIGSVNCDLISGQKVLEKLSAERRLYNINTVRRFDTGSSWLAHWKLECR